MATAMRTKNNLVSRPNLDIAKRSVRKSNLQSTLRENTEGRTLTSITFSQYRHHGEQPQTARNAQKTSMQKWDQKPTENKYAKSANNHQINFTQKEKEKKRFCGKRGKF